MSKPTSARGAADDRYRKIAGITALTVALYLGLAFVSYLFTWKADQDAVLTYGWGVLASDVDVANWLGPLGAIASHTAFFNGFGATSFLFAYLLAVAGLAILRRRPLHELQRQLRWGLAGLMGLSIMLAFLFQMVDFPVGGAYGYLVASFLERMIGVPGMLLLIALVIVLAVVWIFDPSVDELRAGKLLGREEVRAALPGGLVSFVGRVSGRGRSDSSPEAPPRQPAPATRVPPPRPARQPTIDGERPAGLSGAPARARPGVPGPVAPPALGSVPAPSVTPPPPVPPEPVGPSEGAQPPESTVAGLDELDLKINYARGDEDDQPLEDEGAIVRRKPATGPRAERTSVTGVATPKSDAPVADAESAGGSTAAAVPSADGGAGGGAADDTLEPASILPPTDAPAPGQGTPRDILAAEEETEALEQGPYDPKDDLPDYRYPEISLLRKYEGVDDAVSPAEVQDNKRQIIECLRSLKLEVIGIEATVGPTITLYEIVPAPGMRISKFRNIGPDIALNLSALGVRIIAPIPGRGSIGIEVPNKKRQMVALRDVLNTRRYRQAEMALPIALGKTIQNETLVVDLAKMPHLLIAGATGQGKSVGINTIIMSLLYKQHPAEVKLVLVDPKKVELALYSALERHFLTLMPGQDESIITENKKVINTLNSLVIEMDERYALLKAAGVRHITEYNQRFSERRLNPNDGHKFLPYVVIIIDEFADLIMTAGKEIEGPIARIAQLARAVGMHLIIATQRPSVKIITGAIKANFPARLAFRVTSGTDSRTILDSTGAEQLVGMGDMLLSQGTDNVRVQCAFVDTPEVDNVLEFIGEQTGLYDPYTLPEFVGEEDDAPKADILTPEKADSKLREAGVMVVENCVGSTSLLQRRIEVGFNRAGRIMDQLCQLGVVGPARGSKPREVLVRDLLELEGVLERFYAE